MKFSFVLSAICILISSGANAQWLETTLYVPDSFCGLVPPSCLAYNPTNNTIYVGGEGDCVIAIDAATNKKTARIPAGSDGAALCHNSQNNKVYCANSGSDDVTVIDGATNQVIATVRAGGNPSALCYNAAGNKVYCANYGESPNYDSTVTVIDGATNQVLANVTVGSGPIALCYNSQNNKVYSANLNSANVSVIDGATNGVVATVAVGGYPRALCYNPQNNKVYCSGSNVTVIDGAGDSALATVAAAGVALCYDSLDNTIYCASSYVVTVIDAAADTVIDTIHVSGGSIRDPTVLCYNATDNKVYYGNSGRDIKVIDCATNRIVATAPAVFGPRALCHAPQDNRVYCAGGEPVVLGQGVLEARVAAIDGSGNRTLDVIDVGDIPSALCSSPQGDKVYCAGELGSVTVLSGATNEHLAVLRPDSLPGPPARVALCANGRDDKLYWARAGVQAVKVIDCILDTVIASVPVDCHYPRDLCYNQQDNKVYCAGDELHGYDSILTVIDGAGDSVVATVTVGRHGHALCYHPTSNKVYCLNRDRPGSVTVIDGAGDTVVATVTVGDDPWALCNNPANNKVYCTNYSSNSVIVIDGTTDSVLTTVPVGYAPGDLCYNPRNNKVYVGHPSGVTVIDGAGDTVLATVAAAGNSMLYNAQSNKVYCANYSSGSVTVIDGVSDSVVCAIGVGDGPVALCHNPQQNRVYVANYGSLNISVIRDSITGIAEGRKPQASSYRPGPTIVHGCLLLAGNPRTSPSWLLDAAGRKVMELQPGANVVRHLAPGLYFVRSAVGGERPAVCKVVVAR